MKTLQTLLVPLLVAVVSIYALRRRVDVFSAMTSGAAEGLKTVARMFPALVALLSAVYMLRASGVLEVFSSVFAPFFRLLGIPPECAPLILLRPVSGSGALALASELIKTHGADSLIGRSAAVMMGATETTFYVIAVYFGAAGIKRSRHAVPAALCADLAGFCAAALVSRWLWA